MGIESTISERAAYEWLAQSLPRGYWVVMLCLTVMLIVLWFVLGPSHPWYAVMVAMGTLLLGPGVATPVMQRVPRRWFRVPAGERVLHRVLGVSIFRRLLKRSGWERHVHKREFHATKAGLTCLEAALRCNACAHGTGFVLHVLLAAVALVTGHQWGAMWILLLGVIFHLYPVLLQRSILLRLQPLMDQSPTTDVEIARPGQAHRPM